MKKGRIVVLVGVGIWIGISLFTAASGQPGPVRPEMLAALLLVLVIPVRSVLDDGDKKVYSAMLYRVVIWHRRDDTQPGGYRTGREVHFYPKNFKSLDE